MEDYAGRILAERYRLPLPPSDAYELIETRAFDTRSGQEVLVRQVPFPEVVDAELLDGTRGGQPAAGGRRLPPGELPAVRRAIEAAQAAASVPDHPRLDQVFDVFAEGGSLWIVSELVPARPLAALIADEPLSPYRAAEVAADVLTALRVLHAHGWTHRNITMRTVLICEDGRVVLTGLAAGAAEDALCGYDPVPPQDGTGNPAAGPAGWAVPPRPEPMPWPGGEPGGGPGGGAGPPVGGGGYGDWSGGAASAGTGTGTDAGYGGGAPGGPWGGPAADAGYGGGPSGTPSGRAAADAGYGPGGGPGAGPVGQQQGGQPGDRYDDRYDRYGGGFGDQPGSDGGTGAGTAAQGAGSAVEYAPLVAPGYDTGPRYRDHISPGTASGPGGAGVPGGSGGSGVSNSPGALGGPGAAVAASNSVAPSGPGAPGVAGDSGAPSGLGTPGGTSASGASSASGTPSSGASGGAGVSGVSRTPSASGAAGERPDLKAAARAGAIAAYRAGAQAAARVTEQRKAGSESAPEQERESGPAAESRPEGSKLPQGYSYPYGGPDSGATWHGATPRRQALPPAGAEPPARAALPAQLALPQGYQQADTPGEGQGAAAAPQRSEPGAAGAPDGYGQGSGPTAPGQARPEDGAQHRTAPGPEYGPGYGQPSPGPNSPDPAGYGRQPQPAPGRAEAAGPGGQGGPGYGQQPQLGPGHPEAAGYGQAAGQGGPGHDHAAGHGGSGYGQGGPGYGQPAGPGAAGNGRQQQFQLGPGRPDPAGPGPQAGAGYGPGRTGSGVGPGSSGMGPAGTGAGPGGRGVAPGGSGVAGWGSGPRSGLDAERARQTRMAVVGAVTERWAPEQAQAVHGPWQLAAPVGPATDLWGLGALLYRAVQGHAPYPEDSVAELVEMVCAEPPAFAEECGALRPIVESLLRQDPTERPDFEELRGWLRSLVRSAPEPDGGFAMLPPLVDPDPARLPVVRRRADLHGRHRSAEHPRKPRALGRSLLLGILVLLSGAVAYALVFMPGSGDPQGGGQKAAGMRPPAATQSQSPGRSAAPSPKPSGSGQAPSPSASPPESGPAPQTNAPAPPGYTAQQDAEHFAINVPNGWERRGMNESGQVRYTEGAFTLTIVPGRDKVEGNPDPATYQKDKEPELAPYRSSTWATVGDIKSTKVGNQLRVTGRYTWIDGNGRSVVARNFVVALGGSYHVVLVTGPLDQEGKVTETFEQATASYKSGG